MSHPPRSPLSLLRIGLQAVLKESAPSDALLAWAHRVEDVLKAAKDKRANRHARGGRMRRLADTRPADWPAKSGRPPIAAGGEPVTACFACGRAKGVTLSGLWCVTCGQLGHLNGWCGCGAPLYGRGACARGGLKCQARGSPVWAEGGTA